ncbi:MAG: lysostaphin resistance A-like protein [Oscillospiraceae bacterium]
MDTMNDPIVIQSSISRTAARKKAFGAYNRLGFAFVVFLASQVVLPSLISMLLAAVAPALLETAVMGMPVAYFCMYIIGFPCMLLVLKKLPNTAEGLAPAPEKPFSPKQVLLLFPFGYAIMNVLAIAINLIETAIGRSGTVTTADLVAGNTPWWITFVGGVIIAPVMEEIVFRRLVYRKAAGYGAVPYILWSAVVFGLFHLNFGQSIYAAALGAVLAIVTYRTGSVKTTIAMHLLINLTGGVGLGSIILRTQNEALVGVYSIVSLAIMAIGIVCGIILLRTKGLSFHERAPLEMVAKTRTAFLNPGTIVYLVVCIALIVAVFFM